MANADPSGILTDVLLGTTLDAMTKYYDQVGRSPNYDDVVHVVQHAMVQWALNQYSTKTLASKKLGISRATLNRKLEC